MHKKQFNSKHKIVVAGLVGALLFAGMTPVAAFATPSSSTIKSEMTEARNQRDELYEQAEQASEELNTAQSNLDSTNASIESTQNDIASKETDIANAKTQLESSLRQGYKGNNTISNIITMLTDASSISDFTQAISSATQITNDTNEKIADVQQQEQDLQASLNELNSLQAQQQNLVSQCQSKSDELNQKVADADAYINSLSADLKKAIAEEDAAQAAANAAAVTTTTINNSSSSSSATTSSVDTSNLADWRQKILAVAYANVGGSYVWGGSSLRASDCSGLVMQCYAVVGVSMTHSADTQGALYCDKPISQAEPGDIVWHSGHVGIYIGNGKTIEAMNPSEGITYGSVSRFYRCGSPLD